MKNKLGVSEFKLKEVEFKIVNFKFNLLDEYFTFNSNIFELDFLSKLHNFLFSDLYFDYQLQIRTLSKEHRDYINSMFKKIENICKSSNSSKEILLDLIYNIWDLQPFFDGNTRTLLAYLKILNDAFLLGFNIDLNSEIISGKNNFNINNFVNQKRLTKNK